MRLSLLAVPAVVALAASLGCHNTQRVKYDVTGNAVAVDEPTYVAPANNAPVPTVMANPDPTPVAPTVTQAPPAVTPVPANPPASSEPVVVEKPTHHGGHHGEKAEGKNTYVVVKGDTLQKISEKTYGTTKKWHLIMKANKLPDDKIHVGQKLVLPEVEKDAK